MELSIQVSLSGLSFCILDTAHDKILELGSTEFPQAVTPDIQLRRLRELLDTEVFEQYSFRDIRVIHENELSSFVPRSLFNESQLPDYLKYNVKILENDFINYDEIKSHDMVNVYIPFTHINNYLFESFGSFEYKHASTVLVETLINKSRNGIDKKVFINISKNHFEIVVTHQKQLLLYNQYHYQTAADFIYYLMFTIEQLQLNPELTDVILLGNTDRDDELYKYAYKYIRNVHIGNNFNPYKVGKQAREHYADHKNLILLNSF
ncbi:DUF3822 family protein [Robertkochia solimangrovi]|uniref:DUF3822 family protein n=1 Tax=Robertkochia solimangrovi TaxID=2213046 RepID=UPI0013A5640B|nr:DUF3822 family protein [Robertkochia solimangrovi]